MDWKHCAHEDNDESVDLERLTKRKRTRERRRGEGKSISERWQEKMRMKEMTREWGGRCNES